LPLLYGRAIGRVLGLILLFEEAFVAAEREPPKVRRKWVEPEIRELDVRETSAFPGTGSDAGGNPAPDCQHS